MKRMHRPILTMKCSMPPLRPDLVPRPGLFARLDAGLTCKLLLISAAAGSGKTSLVSAWLRQRNLPTAWLAPDAGDNDPARFLLYLEAIGHAPAAADWDCAAGLIETAPHRKGMCGSSSTKEPGCSHSWCRDWQPASGKWRQPVMPGTCLMPSLRQTLVPMHHFPVTIPGCSSR
jgi:hypothetical protein